MAIDPPGYRRKYGVIHRMNARFVCTPPPFCRLGCFSSIFRRTSLPRPTGGTTRSEGIMYYLRKGSDALLRVIGGGIGGASSRAAGWPAAARVCASRGAARCSISAAAPPRRLIGPSITAAAPAPRRPRRPARRASLHPLRRVSTFARKAFGSICGTPPRTKFHRRVNAATRATEIEAYF